MPEAPTGTYTRTLQVSAFSCYGIAVPYIIGVNQAAIILVYSSPEQQELIPYIENSMP